MLDPSHLAKRAGLWLPRTTLAFGRAYRPGACGCCEEPINCAIKEDPFSRNQSTAMGGEFGITDWQRIGSVNWATSTSPFGSIPGNRLNTTTIADAQLKSLVPIPAEVDEFRIELRMEAATGKVGIMFDIDGGTHLAVTMTSTQVELVRHSGGTDTTLASFSGSTHFPGTLWVCVGAGVIRFGRRNNDGSNETAEIYTGAHATVTHKDWGLRAFSGFTFTAHHVTATSADTGCPKCCELSGCEAWEEDLSEGASNAWIEDEPYLVLNCDAADPAMVALVELSGSGRAILQWSNENNYLFGEFTAGDPATLAVGRVAGGNETILDECEFEPLGGDVLCVSYAAGQLAASYAGIKVSAATSALPGRRFALEGSGFGEFVAHVLDDAGECGPCTGDPCPVPSTGNCNQCDEGEAYEWYLVEISGVAADFGLCEGPSCDALNGVYVVGPLEQRTVGSLSVCVESVEILGVCRDDNSCFSFLQIQIWRPTTGIYANQYILRVELVSGGDCDESGGLPIMSYTHVFGAEQPECLDPDLWPLTIPTGDVDFAVSPKCSAGSVTLTPIPPP